MAGETDLSKPSTRKTMRTKFVGLGSADIFVSTTVSLV